MGAKNTLIYRLVALLAVLALVGAACGDDDNGGSGGGGEGGEPVELTFAASTCGTYYYGYHIAMQQGYFEDEGIDLTLECTGGSAEVAQFLAADNVDFGGGGTSPMLPVIQQGTPLYPFFLHTYGEPYDIMVPGDSDVQSIADLKGTDIGVTELAGGEVPILKALLAQNGIDPEKDVNILEVGLDPAAVQLGFEKGTISAYSSSLTDLSIITSAGIDIRSVVPEGSLSEYPAGGLFATEDLSGDTELLGRIGRAAAKGFLVAYANLDGALCLVAEAIPEEFVDFEAGRAGVEGALPVTTAPQNSDGTYEFGAGISNAELWNDYIQLYADAGVLEEAFDMEPYLVDVTETVNDFDQQAVIDEANELPSDCA